MSYPQYDVPFDDIYGLIDPAWYENPYTYLISGGVICAAICVWWSWRWLQLRSHATSSDHDQHIREPSYWYDALSTTDLNQQKQIYADFMTYLKHTVHLCYTNQGMALTNTELIAWAWNHLPSEYAQNIQTVARHAEHVRFQKTVVDAFTLYNDYMIVNEVASYMQSCDSVSNNKNTS